MNPSDKRRILQIILNLQRDGAQGVLLILARHFVQRGHHVTVCSFEDGPVRHDLEQLGITVELVDRPRYSVVALPLFLAELWRIRRALADIINRDNLQIAQTHLLEVLDFVTLSLRGTGSLKVVVWTIHNVEILPTMPHWLIRAKRVVYRWLYRQLATRVDGFIAVSDEVRNSLLTQLGPIESKISTIANGIDTDIYRQISPTSIDLPQLLQLQSLARFILVVGRLTEQKGHRYLIDALPTIIETHPQTHFLFVGDGALRDSLQQQAAAVGCATQVHFLGKREDVPQLLVTCDMFVLPSLWEGLSLALLEAMAARKPIVATQVSGTVQLIQHQTTGLLVPAADSAALAEAIIELLNQPERAAALGEAAYQFVEAHYSAAQQAQQHLDLYERLLQ